MHFTKSTRTAGLVLTVIFGLVLTGCGGSDASAVNYSDDNVTGDAELPIGFPVGEPFSDATWSIDGIEQSDEVTVRGDLLVVHTAEGPLRAYSSDGSQRWSYDLPENANGLDVQVGNETVAILAGGTSAGEGLSDTKTIANVILLSIDDGLIVTETEIPLASAADFPPNQLKGDKVYLTEDGSHHNFPEQYFEAFPNNSTRPGGPDGIKAIVDGNVLWSDNGGNNLVSEKWRDDDHTGPKLIDRPRGRILVSEPGVSQKYGSMLDTANGNILFDIVCPDNPDAATASGTWSNPSGGIETVSSPNSQFLISGAIWMSDTEGRCVGGGEGQQSVTLTAVDDAGTAYGMTSEGRLVVVPSNGEPQVSDLPETGAHGGVSPFAVMDGNLALHWNGSTVTANPIK